MNRLRLERFETIQSDHHVLSMPDRAFVKLLRLRTFKVAPVEEIGHSGSRLFGFHAKLPHRGRNDEIRSWKVTPRDLPATKTCEKADTTRLKPVVLSDYDRDPMSGSYF